MSSPASQSPPITKTGMQGFLLWFKREQPALYNKIAPSIPKVAPKAFSNYTARRKRLGALYRSKFMRHKVGVAGLADYSSYTLPATYVTAPSLDPITVNYTAQLSVAPTYASMATAPLYASYVSAPSYTASPTAGVGSSVPTVNTGSPVASAANTGSIGTNVVGAVGALIGAAAAVTLTNQQAALQQQAVNTNLQRAAAGLPPLNTSLNALGVPTVAGTGLFSDPSSLLLLGGAALLALMLMGSKSSV